MGDWEGIKEQLFVVSQRMWLNQSHPKRGNSSKTSGRWWLERESNGEKEARGSRAPSSKGLHPLGEVGGTPGLLLQYSARIWAMWKRGLPISAPTPSKHTFVFGRGRLDYR